MQAVQLGIFILYLIVALLAAIQYYKYKATPLVWVLPVFVLTLLTEVVGYGLLGSGYTTAIHFNLRAFLHFSMLLIVYGRILNTVSTITFFPYNIIVFVIATIASFIIEDVHTGMQILYFTGAGLLLAHIAFYLIHLLKSDKILRLHRILLLYISLGYLLFYIGYLPIRISRIYLIQEANYMAIYWYQLGLIFVSNILFITGFLCFNRKHLY